MRMLAGILAAQPFTTTMIGDESLSRRPMRRVIEPLAQMGARIDAVDGHAPLTDPRRAAARRSHYAPDGAERAGQERGASSPACTPTGTTSVTEPAQTRDHTERALAAFGFEVRVDGLTVSVDGGQRGTRPDAAGPRRLLLRRVLDGRRRVAAGLRGRPSSRSA